MEDQVYLENEDIMSTSLLAMLLGTCPLYIVAFYSSGILVQKSFETITTTITYIKEKSESPDSLRNIYDSIREQNGSYNYGNKYFNVLVEESHYEHKSMLDHIRVA